MRRFTAILISIILSALLMPGVAFAKKHHTSDYSSSTSRRHYVKVANMSPAERRALRRMERRAQIIAKHKSVAKRHDDSDEAVVRHKVAQSRTHHKRQIARDESDTPRHRRVAERRHTSEPHAVKAASHVSKHNAVKTASHDVHHSSNRPARVVTAKRPTRHELRMAKHEARLAAHNARLAKIQARRNARLAKIQAAHEARARAHARRVADQQLRHTAQLAKKATANAKLATKSSQYVAAHGDDTSGKSIYFWQTRAAKIPVKVITVDLNDKNVKVSGLISRFGDGTSEPFRQMIQRANPNVAVTGTFFSLDNLKPVGDIVIDGSLVHFGGMGTALCITPNNKADMVTCTWGRHHDWSQYDFVCACGPRLLKDGRVVLDPHAEKFKDKHMLSPNSRIAVGITRSNKLVFAMTREAIYLGRLAKVMKELGCSEAMNLDAGTSTGFYFNGATLAKPGRKLTNLIVVYGRKDRYEKALDQLVPASMRRSARRVSSSQTPN